MNNEPAFPCGTDVTQGQFAPTSGMTLRDYFAAKAMQGLIAAFENGDVAHVSDHDILMLSDGLSYTDGWRGRIAVASYAIADAMLEARSGMSKREVNPP